MYKQGLFVVIITMLTLTVVFAAPPATHPETGEDLLIDCLRGTPVAIDGDLGDWNLAAMTPASVDVAQQVYTGTWDGPEDCSAQFYLLWDDTNIYMAVVVKDDALSMTKTSGDIWNCDCIEVFFSTLNAVSDCSEHYQYGFNANDDRWNWCNMDGNGSAEPDYLQVASSRTPDGYICEVAIEYGQMLSLNFAAGSTIGFHPCIDDTESTDREIQMTWTGREAHDQSEGYGHIYLSSEPARLPELSRNPSPANEAVDVALDAILSWDAGDYAVTHDVYFGTSFDDANDGTTPTSAGQSESTYDPGLLEYGQTYYWRVDEVNGAPDNTVFKGEVWSFATEPMGRAIANIIATSNIASEGNAAPERTVDGSGLSGNDGHSLDPDAMWLVKPAEGETAWIQYEFNHTYKLYQMVVWNYSSEFEGILGFGLKDVTVEYSLDGVEWTTLGDFEFAQSATVADFAAGTAVDFGNVTVQYVRLTANSCWGGRGQYGLAEVQFLAIPVSAREPEPADGATEVDRNATLQWRPGRGAVSHEVYFSADQAAVADGTAFVDTAATNSYAPGSLNFGETYYWKVDEVNEAEAMSVWEGDIWSFVVEEFAVLDDFEAYDDDANRIYSTWEDGWVNGTGAMVGYMDEPFAEQMIVNGGIQSMPLQYDNSYSPFYSEGTRTWSPALDLTAGEADSLRLYFQGAAENTAETVYVAVEDSSGQVAVVVNPDADAALATQWQEWRISYSVLSGVDLTSVARIHIGLGDRDNPQSGGSGILYVDDLGFGHAATGPNLLSNGGFEAGVMDPWGTYGDVTAEVVTDGAVEGTSCLHVTVGSAGANFWDSGLQHTGHVFEAGKQYTLSAFLRCSEGTLDINFKPELAADPWSGFGDQVLTMTDEWAEYSVTTPVLENDVDPAAITFHIGFAAADFWIDNVRFYEEN